MNNIFTSTLNEFGFLFNDEGLDWYNTLDIDTKINLKMICKNILGVSFDDLGYFYGFKFRINLMYDKLKRMELL